MGLLIFSLNVTLDGCVDHRWTGVSLVALDARWSAMRFRPRALVGT